jgi:Ca2+-binding RTX toxin-like protein
VPVNGTGNALDNTLIGSSTDNILDGGAGIDTYDGGYGNDTYIIDNLAELGNITDGDGLDTIQTALKLDVSNVVADIESYTYTGSADWKFDISSLGGVYHALRGSTGSDQLTTGSSLDFLDGGAGADTLTGGSGRDIYVIDNLGDKIFDSDTENQLVINRSVDLTSNSGLNAQFFGLFDTVALTGTANLNVTGDSRDNSLYGNNGANIIDGGEGADFMAGGLGNDTYFVDQFGDIALENIGGGIDTVKSAVDVYLPGFDLPGLRSEIENVIAFGATIGVNFVGNDFNNGLTGSEFNDTLDGGAGNDILTGGKGDDIYIVDSAGDKIVESSGGGIDTVQSSTDFSIAAFANVENVTLVDGWGKFNSNATGNALANTLTGNDGDNVLDGGKGIDTFEGGAGNDTFIIDDHAELAHITDLGGGDKDTIISSVLLSSSDVLLDIEGYVYTGSAKWVFDVSGVDATNYSIVGGSGADILTGGSYSDYLDGGKGNDILTGGEGDDTYIIDSVGDVVNETGTTDYDGIVSNRSINLQTEFGGKIESATLTGTALDATGNAAQNTLIGNDGANKLSGLAGYDTLTGGKGDDILSGGADGDRFIYNALSDRGTGKEVITDFVLRDDDVLDLHNLMESLNIPTGDWFGDGILAFTDDGKGNTIVQLDLDGGADSFVTLVTLVGVTLTEQDARNYEL